MCNKSCDCKSCKYPCEDYYARVKRQSDALRRQHENAALKMIAERKREDMEMKKKDIIVKLHVNENNRIVYGAVMYADECKKTDIQRNDIVMRFHNLGNDKYQMRFINMDNVDSIRDSKGNEIVKTITKTTTKIIKKEVPVEVVKIIDNTDEVQKQQLEVMSKMLSILNAMKSDIKQTNYKTILETISRQLSIMKCDIKDTNQKTILNTISKQLNDMNRDIQDANQKVVLNAISKQLNDMQSEIKQSNVDFSKQLEELTYESKVQGKVQKSVRTVNG